MENESQRILMPQEKKDEKPPVEERPGIIEAILFVSGNAVDKADMCKAMALTESELDEALNTLESLYDFDRRGLRLLRFGAHVQLATRPDYAVYVENILQPVQRQSLSQAIMETLAVIAYKQPVTKAEVEQIRGVKCDYSIQSLIAKGLIIEMGRKEALGRPILYGTTDAFLRHFCISSLNDLPEIDFSKLGERDGDGQAVEDGTFDLGTVSAGDGEDRVPDPGNAESDDSDEQTPEGSMQPLGEHHADDRNFSDSEQTDAGEPDVEFEVILDDESAAVDADTGA
ncbi:MAG: SMC-Scp complex subunit ScpB [Clostridia bacterium]|nr:SMC-Scp complex subunit ScpB [Clostridia bacterium]